MRRLLVLASTAFSLWASGSQASTNLIANGNFENPQAVGTPEKLLPGANVGGWLVGGEGADHVYLYYDPTPQLAGGSGIEGYQHVQIKNSERDGGYLSQVVDLAQGSTYELSFYVGSADPDNNPSQLDISSQFPVDTLQNTYPIGSVPIPSTGGIGIKHWRQQLLSFTAQAAQERLVFRNDSSGYLLLDDVSLIFVVPEPSSLALVGLAVVMFSRNFRARHVAFYPVRPGETAHAITVALSY
jgi:hypothetical protein